MDDKKQPKNTPPKSTRPQNAAPPNDGGKKIEPPPAPQNRSITADVTLDMEPKVISEHDSGEVSND